MAIPLRKFSSPLHLPLLCSPSCFSKSQKKTSLTPPSVCRLVSFVPGNFFRLAFGWLRITESKISFIYWVGVMQIGCRCCCLLLNACEGGSPAPLPHAGCQQGNRWAAATPGRAPEGYVGQRLLFSEGGIGIQTQSFSRRSFLLTGSLGWGVKRSAQWDLETKSVETVFLGSATIVTHTVFMLQF